MNKALLLFPLVLAAPALAQDGATRLHPPPQERPATVMPAPRDDDATLRRRQRGDQYILHDRAVRKPGPSDSGYGLDLMMSPRRSPTQDRR